MICIEYRLNDAINSYDFFAIFVHCMFDPSYAYANTLCVHFRRAPPICHQSEWRKKNSNGKSFQFLLQSNIKRKKTRKLRGHVSHGHGRIGKCKKYCTVLNGRQLIAQICDGQQYRLRICIYHLSNVVFASIFRLCVGKHRKHPGGRGNAGGMHHHRINFDKYHPGYFGKLGMRNFHLNRNDKFCPSINLDKLWSLVPEDKREECRKSKDGQVPVVDLVKFVSVFHTIAVLTNRARQPNVNRHVHARCPVCAGAHFDLDFIRMMIYIQFSDWRSKATVQIAAPCCYI